MVPAFPIQLDTPKSYTIKAADGSEPRKLFNENDHQVIKTILTAMTRACDSAADVSFVVDKIFIDALKIEVYSVDMYVETNTDVLMDELNAIMGAYPSRIHRHIKIRTTRRPDIHSLYATRVHLEITTHDYALIPSRVDVCHIYSPAIPLQRNVATGLYAAISNASDTARNAPQRLMVAPRTHEKSWYGTFGSFLGLTNSSATPTTDFIFTEPEEVDPNSRSLKRPRLDT